MAVIPLIFVIGTTLRLLPVAIHGFSLPLSLGGLYDQFSDSISDNGYRLPQSIPFYTEGGIPFAYPPLAFYVQAALKDIFQPSDFLIVNLLPPFVAVLTLPAFYRLLLELRLDALTRRLAFFAYATIPIAFHGLTHAESLPKSFGVLAVIIVVIQAMRTYRRSSLRNYILLGIALALAILTYPRATLASILAVLALVSIPLAARQTNHSFKLLAMQLANNTAMLTTMLIVTAPYWITVIVYHSPTLILSTVSGENWLSASARSLANLQPTTTLGPWNFLILSGLFHMVIRRQWPHAAWLGLSLLLQRQIGEYNVALPASVLAAHGVSGFIAPLLHRSFRHPNTPADERTPQPFMSAVTLFYLAFVLYALTMGYYHSYRASQMSNLELTELRAMHWVRDNTPHDARFIFLSGTGPASEWLPRISQRTLLNPWVGLEWERHTSEGGTIRRLLAEYEQCFDMECVDRSTSRVWPELDYYVFAVREETPAVSQNLLEDDRFQVLFQSSNVIVAQRK